ncbi:MAG: hypothetical protein FJ246_07865 [Nitrospira sp.]|nr:hypothetical protein [Nitrospira sp.]
MAWPGSKQALKAKRGNPKQKINWEQLGLETPAKGQSIVPIDEIRRQVTLLAGRSLGQGVRSRQVLAGTGNAASDRSAETPRRNHRGAPR